MFVLFRLFEVSIAMEAKLLIVLVLCAALCLAESRRYIEEDDPYAEYLSELVRRG